MAWNLRFSKGFSKSFFLGVCRFSDVFGAWLETLLEVLPINPDDICPGKRIRDDMTGLHLAAWFVGEGRPFLEGLLQGQVQVSLEGLSLSFL